MVDERRHLGPATHPLSLPTHNSGVHIGPPHQTHEPGNRVSSLMRGTHTSALIPRAYIPLQESLPSGPGHPDVKAHKAHIMLVCLYICYSFRGGIYLA